MDKDRKSNESKEEEKVGNRVERERVVEVQSERTQDDEKIKSDARIYQ